MGMDVFYTGTHTGHGSKFSLISDQGRKVYGYD